MHWSHTSMTFRCLTVLFLLCIFFGCSKTGTSITKDKPRASVVVSKPITLAIVEWDEFVGRLSPVDSVQVRARVSGYLASTDFEEGQFVQAGDIIAIIDQRPFLSEVARNNANLTAAKAQLGVAESAVAQAVAEVQRSVVERDLAKKQLDRNAVLKQQNASSLQDLEIAQAEFDKAESEITVSKSRVESARSMVISAQAAMDIAQANLNLANLNLQYTELRAPIHGRISSRLVTEGNLISGGMNDATLITTIVSMDPIHCYFDADEQTYLKYMKLAREGTRPSSREVRNPVYLALSNEHEGFPHLGQMDFVETRVDEETGTVRGRAILPNDALELTPGLFARLRLPGSPQYNAILIPDRAVGTDQAEKFVLVVDDSDKIVRKLVTLGPMSHGLRIVRSGLSGDEQIVISGQQRVRPGVEVAATMEQVKPGAESLPDEYHPVPQEEWLKPKRSSAGNIESIVRPPDVAKTTKPHNSHASPGTELLSDSLPPATSNVTSVTDQ
jgi:membrane fusion protein, multidrug efflux system